MRRALLLTAMLAVAVGSCLPGTAAEPNAPRLPKIGTRPIPGTLPPSGDPLARTPTVGPPPEEGQIVPQNYPPPFSYGPVFTPPTPIPSPVEPLNLPTDAVNILLLGSDRRSARSFRTDTILVLSIHPNARAAALVSIPRDLYVYLPGYNMQRINAAMPLGDDFGYPGGGYQMLSDAILYNLGLKVHYYAQVEMDGFRAIVDELGGIDVHVTCSYTDWRLEEPDLDPQEEENWELFTVPAGVVPMDGDYALWYARSRARSSDFDRARRQQEVLRAIHRRALRLGIIPQLPDLYNELIQSVSTDMALSDMLRLAPLATRIDAARVRSRFIGRDQVMSWRTPTGGQVVLPKQEEIADLLSDALDFEEMDPTLPDQELVIEIQNATAHKNWHTLAGERLTYAGFKTRILPGSLPSIRRSQLRDYGLAGIDRRNQILSALGLPASIVEGTSETSGDAAFRLVVGDDFDPCFDPTRNQ